jgi:hypothetical protein
MLSNLMPVRERDQVKSFSVGAVKLLKDWIPMSIVSFDFLYGNEVEKLGF